jgi:hypothetical protein
VHWTILDLDTGHVFVDEDGSPIHRLERQIVPSALGAAVRHIGIMVRVFRRLGTDDTEFLNDGLRLDIGAPLAPGAYVRWRYQVKNPQIAFDGDGGLPRYHGDTVVQRSSALHKRLHCNGSKDPSRYGGPPTLFDRLPFPVGTILDRRAALCDYCFFGGPGGTRPSL